MRFIENLYVYLWQGRGNNCHTYLFANVLRGERPHVLIDPGHVVNEVGEHCLGSLLNQMSLDRIRPEEVGLILNTHSHRDHCEANKALVERSRGEGGIGRALIALSQEEDEFRKASEVRVLGLTAEFEPDFYLKEGELSLGQGERKLILQVLHTPGHTPGSLCFYWPKNKVLITGDVLFYGGVGRTDLPGGDGKELRRSIQRLSELDVEYILPGHSTEFGDLIRGREKVRENFAFLRLNYFPLL